jgi:glyoxylase-like metal-dependent hydrolase (beta-lactamase superfamily II)
MAQSAAEYVATRRIGDATVTLVNDGVFDAIPLIPWMDAPADEVRRAVPDADDTGNIGRSGMIVAHVQVGSASVLIDPGVGELDPTSWLATELKLRPTPGVQAGLAAAGIQPEQITHVLITHAHGDHFTGATVLRDGQRMPRYPRARYVIGRADWESNPERADPASEVSTHLGTLERLGLLDLAEGDYAVAQGVTMIAAPGESPGHSIVRVESAGERFYSLGDLFHHTCEAEHLEWVMTERDTPAMIASRRRLVAEAVPSRAILVFTHNVFPGWGRIVAGDAGYRWVPT